MEIAGEHATNHFKAFVGTLYYLIHEKNLSFDLVIGSGNTGILCAKFTELVYKKLNKQMPPILQIPVLRYKGEEKPENLFDNSVLFSEVQKFMQQRNIKKLENVLFVDDEIYGGNALKAVMKLVVDYKTKFVVKGNTLCYVVAEDQGVESEFLIPEVKTKFYPFATGVDGTSNVTTYFMPLELENPIKEVLGSKIGTHTVINILLDLPLRQKGTDITKPEFRYTYNDLVKQRIPNFSHLQEKAWTLVDRLIDEAIQDYRTGKIHLPFQSFGSF